MSTQRVVCEHSLRVVLSSLSSPHHRILRSGRACSQATQQALVRYSQKDANQWKRWEAFKLAACVCSAIQFQTPFRSQCLFVLLFSLTRSDRCFPRDILCISFHCSAEVISRDFYFPTLWEALYGLREVCSSCKKCLCRHDANYCRWKQRAGNQLHVECWLTSNVIMWPACDRPPSVGGRVACCEARENVNWLWSEYHQAREAKTGMLKKKALVLYSFRRKEKCVFIGKCPD